MRCKNCGWPNRPEETTCSKCGTPLESSSIPSPSDTGHSNQTVREGDIFGASAQPNICAKCGYPLRPGQTKCPNCNTDLSGNVGNNVAQPSSPQNRAVRRPTVVGVPNIHGTVNVWTDGGLGLTPSFVLSPVKRNGERKEPEDIELEGDTVSLNRDNTDPGNLSITSRTQAIITRKDDKWYIEDKSEQKTTFVQAGQPQELHEGDIILLGNRLFIFHE